MVNIGGIMIETPLALAPMAGVTDASFRAICREQGAGLTCTEMVSAKALCYQDKKTLPLMELGPDEHPAGVQVFGSDLACMEEAAAIIREAGTPATGNGRPSAALANAIEALEKQLSFVGWVEAGEVYRLCAERDISVSTIRRARVALGLKTLYIGNQPNRKNYWYQPELEEASVVADITNQNQQIQLA